MTSYVSADAPESFIPTSEVFPADNQQFLGKLDYVYTNISKNLNSKDIGRYELTEFINGQQFFDLNDFQNRRLVFRKCFTFAAIAIGGSVSFAHGITGITMLTRMYGTFISGTTFRPLPYMSISGSNQGVELLINGTDIQVINGAAGPNISSGIVVIEYVKN